ncbi:O-fucosyltransferase family protein [Citrifermentans bremense]|uniref:glycosyl transferase n=1 Tax=Citrifermentans bremense TaxID=60035 RepID=UPI0012ECB09F|nr:glycosyl transferase [Citrifermentans bremense]
MTRTIALDNGFEFGIMGSEKFKGHEFLALDFGKAVKGGTGPEGGPPISLPDRITNYYIEKDIWHPIYQCDIRDYDSGLRSVWDNTKIEGYFQSELLIQSHKQKIREWLKVKPDFDCYEFCDDNLCVMNIRGGEYRGNDELLLGRKYWVDAVQNMLSVNPKLTFIIVTDDVKYAQKLLPEYEAHHYSIGKDYSIIKNAKYLILSNSSFAFFPTWTSETVKYVIAPKYWARHNVSDGFWACGFNLYRDWMWQDRSGHLFSFEQCRSEYELYKIEHGVNQFGCKASLKQQNVVARCLRKAIVAASKVKHCLWN